MAGQDGAAHLTHPSKKSSGIACERQRLRTGGVVKPRKVYLAFQFLQDTKLSLGSAGLSRTDGCFTGVLGLQGAWGCPTSK